jgi:thiol:disulfide interchange protein
MVMGQRIHRIAFSLVLLCGALTQHVNSAPTRNVAVSLVAETSSIQAGSTFWVGFRQVIKPGWHTYWRNPGDSGAATSLNWTLPDGFSISEIHWPYPERIPYGPLMNFGYHGEVMLLFEVTAAEELSSAEITLTADAQWLVCEDICIPENESLSLTLPVSAGPRTRDEQTANWFAQARQRIPQTLALQSALQVSGSALSLHIEVPGMGSRGDRSVEYFPFSEGVIDYPREQRVQFTSSGFDIALESGWLFEEGKSSLAGIVVVTEEVAGTTLRTAFEIDPGAGQSASVQVSFLTAVMFALLGGMILNLMPCVFPVLSIKVLALIEGVGEASGEIRRHGLVYLAGVIVSFVLIAALLLALRSAGAQIGWGFQLQSPVVVALLAYLFLLIGLNLAGYFEIGLSWMSAGDALASRRGYSGSFFTGVLATVVAAPCTAPFMGAAIGYAVTQSSIEALAIFAALGAGMGLPFVVLCFSPVLLQRLPRPGGWMIRFKEFLAFPMFASAIWLVWVLGLQAGADGVLLVLSGMLLLGFVIWLGKQGGENGAWLNRMVSVLLVLTALGLTGGLNRPADTSDAGVNAESSGPVSLPYSEPALAQARSQGPVFVNFTAAWCITCKVNELAALKSDVVKASFEELGIQYLKGDWTNEDPVISKALARYGRSGVPLYLFYPADGADAIVLPQILTRDIVLDVVQGL